MRITYLKLLTIFFMLVFCNPLFAQDDLIVGQEEFLRGDYDGMLLAALEQAADNPEHAYLPLVVASEISKQYLSKVDLGVGLLEKLNLDGGLDADSRGLVQKMLADIYGAQGEEFKASMLRQQSGVIPVWRIAGPFGDYESASYYQSYEPESTIDFSIFMAGLGKDVTWRLLSESVCLNKFIPYKWISPARGVVYLYTQFQLKDEQEIVLEREGGGAFSFWIDGLKSGGVDYMEEEAPKIVSFKSAGKLGAGWHRLLVKLYDPEKNSVNNFRLLNNDLLPVKGIQYDLKKVEGKNGFGSKRWEKLSRDLSRYNVAEKALYYHYMGMYDKALVAWQEAINEFPAVSALRVYYAACVQRAGDILPGPMRESIAQREALKALELDGNAVASLLQLAEYERRHKRYKEAGEYFEKALKINPEAVIIHGARIRMALANGWSGELEEWLEDFIKLYPQSYLLNLLEGMRYNSNGHVSDAAEYLYKAMQLDQENVILGTDCIKSLFASAKVEKALSAWERLPRYLQERADLLVLYSEILARLNHKQRAVAALNRASDAVGVDAEIKRREGDVLFVAGDDEAARELYKESLKLDGGNYPLRRLVKDLDGVDYRFWEKYIINPMEKIEEFARSDKSYRGRTARLIDQTVITLYPDGAYANYTHELQSVLTESGVAQAAIVDTYGELLQARTILPERGVSLEPIILPGSKDITMPAVSAGSVIEHTYLLQHPSTFDGKLRFPKWYFRSPNNEESFLFSQYIVRVPEGVEFAFATRNLGEKVEFSSFEEDDGTQEFVWTGKDMPEAIHEEGSPAIGATLPFVEIASKQNWEDVRKSMLPVYLGKTIPFIPIKKKVEELLQNIDSIRDKITAIYEFVCREIVISGSRAPASHVLLQRAGDRKLLILAMFAAAGIEADLVAVRPPENILYAPIWKLPNSMNFIDYLVRAHGENNEYIWLDLRAKYAGVGKIGEDFSGGTGFVIGRDKSEFVILPPAVASEYLIKRSREYSIGSGYGVDITGEIKYSGTRGWEFKEHFAGLAEDLRLGVLEEILAGSLFGVSVDQFSLPALEVSGTGFNVDYTAHIADFLREQVAGGWGIPYALPEIGMLPKADSNDRRTPYHLSNFLAAQDRYTYKLPEGAVVKKLPEDVLIRSKFGLYRLSFSLVEQEVILERKYVFKPQIIPLDEWKEYYNLAGEIKQAEAGYIWFERD